MKEIDAKTLQDMRAKGEEFTLVDLREPYETENCTLGGMPMPMSQLMDRLDEIPKDRPVVMHCRSGARSKAVVDTLCTRYGFTNLIHLTGGIQAWQAHVDKSLHCD
jgi:rhodanese-related sulfurtransferase